MLKLFLIQCLLAYYNLLLLSFAKYANNSLD